MCVCACMYIYINKCMHGSTYMWKVFSFPPSYPEATRKRIAILRPNHLKMVVVLGLSPCRFHHGNTT